MKTQDLGYIALKAQAESKVLQSVVPCTAASPILLIMRVAWGHVICAQEAATVAPSPHVLAVLQKIARLRQTLHHTGGSPLITRRHVMFSEEAEPQLSKTAEQSAEPKSDSVPDAASQDPEAARSTAKLKR